jgi:hypothetical protein
MKGLAVLAGLALAGCATTSAGLYESKVEMILESARPPQEVATCVVERLRWSVQMRNQGDHYWVLRLSSYGSPTVRWDFLPQDGGGTRAELRMSIPIASGEDRVRECL